MKAKAAAKHRALLDAINEDKIAAYAKGGMVPSGEGKAEVVIRRGA